MSVTDTQEPVESEFMPFDPDADLDHWEADAPPAPPTPADPAASYTPVKLDHMLIHHIWSIQSTDEFLSMFRDFEEQIEATITPLKILLDKVIMTSEVTQLENHSAHVERWRSRATRYWSLALAFVEHGKSSRFMDLKQASDGGKKLTDSARDAYKKTMTAGYVALAARLEGLIDDIDSRVNLCKKYTDGEAAGFKHYRGVVSTGRHN